MSRWRTALGWTGGLSAYKLLLALARLYILSRLLLPADFGLFALALSVLSVVEIGNDLGFGVGLLNRARITIREESSLYWFGLGVSTILAGLLAGIGPLLASYYESPDLAMVLAGVAVVFWLSALGYQPRLLLRRELRFSELALQDAVSLTVGFIITIISAYSGYGVWSLIHGGLIQAALGSGYLLVRRHARQAIQWHFSWPEVRPYLRVGLYQTAGQFLNYFSRDLDILLIGKLIGISTLGGYNLVRQIARRPLQLVNPIVNQVAAPLLAADARENKALGPVYLRLVGQISGVNFPLYAVGIALAEPLIRFLISADYLVFVPVLRWLCAYFLLRSLYNPVGNLVVATARTRREFWWNVGHGGHPRAGHLPGRPAGRGMGGGGAVRFISGPAHGVLVVADPAPGGG